MIDVRKPVKLTEDQQMLYELKDSIQCAGSWLPFLSGAEIQMVESIHKGCISIDEAREIVDRFDKMYTEWFEQLYKRIVSAGYKVWSQGGKPEPFVTEYERTD
jgi:hypothetical protein